MIEPQNIDWIEKKDSLLLDGRSLINGERVASDSKRLIDIFSPRDGNQLTEISITSKTEVNNVVKISRKGFDDGVWSRIHPSERRKVLLNWASAIESEREELALLISLEMGKPIKDAYQIELRSVINSVKWYAEACNKLVGNSPNVGINSLAVVNLEPAGVVGIVLPWNFPLSMVGYDIAPALAIGNSVIVKPSEMASLSVLRCCELAISAGVPPSALNVITGDASTGEAIGVHNDVDIIAVTGKTSTGLSFLKYSSQSNGKRIWPKLGGKSSFIVCADAPNLERASQAATWGSYFNQGQMCTGSSRIFLEQSIYDEFSDLFCEDSNKLILGDPLKWETNIGPLLTKHQVNHQNEVIEDALNNGAKLVQGGGLVDVIDGGYYFQPTLFSEVSLETRIFKEEVFGPITGFLKFDNIKKSISDFNKHGYGMALSLWTSSITNTFFVGKKVKVGTVWVNCFEGDDLSVPFGGVKKSGYGRDKSLIALEKYSDFKTIWLQLDDSSYW